MKTKLFLFLTAIALTFQGCSSSDDTTPIFFDIDEPDTTLSPFAGTWNGTYSGDDSGTWTFTLRDNGSFVSGSSTSNTDGNITNLTSVTINANGNYASAHTWGTQEGQVTGGNLNGTWVNSSDGATGTLTGSKQ